MKRTLGYVISAMGLVFLLVADDTMRKVFLITLPAGLKGSTLLVIGIAALAIGVLILFKKTGTKQPHEVPIYHGNRIVGYRRV